MVITELTTISELCDNLLEGRKVYGLVEIDMLEDFAKCDKVFVIDTEHRETTVAPEQKEEPPAREGFTKVDANYGKPERTDYLFEDDRPMTDTVPVPRELMPVKLGESADNVIDKFMPLVSNKTFPIIEETESEVNKLNHENKTKKQPIDREWIKDLYYQGKKQKEIAKIIGCSQGSVSSILSQMVSRGEI